MDGDSELATYKDAEQTTITLPEDGSQNGATKNKTNEQVSKHEKQTKIFSLVPLKQRCGDCRSIKYDTVMKMLEEFQSQSKWREHKHLTTTCLQNIAAEEDIPDFEIVLCLEQGTAELLQKKFPLAKKFFRDALRLCEKSNNVSLLLGRTLMFLGNAYRKQGPRKFGKAFKCLTLAEQNLSLVEPGEDRAELNYFFGALHLNVLSMCGREPSQKARDKIESYYEAVHEFAMLDPALRVHERIQRIFPLGMANFLLDGQTEVARSRVVSESKLKRAEDCLNHFCNLFPLDKQPVSMKTDYYKSRSDLEYRRGNFTNSKVRLRLYKVSETAILQQTTLLMSSS